MTIRLGQNNYGKSRVRLLRLSRGPERHDVMELTVAIRMEGDFETAHSKGDNSKVLPTDTMKNTVYALARLHKPESPEGFAIRLAEHFLANNAPASMVGVDAAETLWVRIPQNGAPHPSAFVQAGNEKRTVALVATRASVTIEAGIEDLVAMKTSHSGFEGYPRDKYTTLKETADRIFCTAIRATWIYGSRPSDFNGAWRGVREKLLTAFAAHESLSVQHTLYAMGEAALQAFPELREIRLSLPNKHYNLVDLSPLGMDNPNVVFVPTDEPHGLIETTLKRD
jgi:urate oxidase